VSNRVSASEYHLLTIARGVVGQETPDAVEPLLRQKKTIAAKIGPTSMKVLRDTLAKGMTLELARRGGWRRDKRPAGAAISEGRSWERHPKLELEFSAASFALLRWLAEQPIGHPDASVLPVEGKITVADEALLYLAADLLVSSGLGGAVECAAFRRSSLCWLGFVDPLGKDSKSVAALSPDRFTRFTAGEGTPILEALLPDLARRWVLMERAKREIVACDRMHANAAAQQALLEAFFASADSAGRRDLADFLLDAAAKLVARPVPADAWVEALDPRATLSERSNARKAAGAFLRAIGRTRTWAEEARVVRFFEDGYDRAQLLLARWERLGDEGWRRVETVLKDLESFDVSREAPAKQGGATT
jgi:hypothetical protein